MAKEFIIDSYIGAGYYSKQYVRAMLANEKGKQVVAKLSSLGGDLGHAVDIHDQFAEHGNVTVEFTGFNASSSTIISLGAKKIRMSRNSYYLVHKVASWIDEFGYKNEDDLEKLIADLEKEKDENKKITLNVAKMYVDRTGKTPKQILDLMKLETWLTAEEALSWGFVDEIFDPKQKVNHLEDAHMVALIGAAGFPLPERKSLNPNTMHEENTELPKDQKSLTAFISKMFGITPKTKKNSQQDEQTPDQDKRIADLEAKIAQMETDKADPEKIKSKANVEDPEKAKKIAQLEAKLAILENPGKKNENEQPEDVSEQEDADESEKDARIAELEAQVVNLGGSVTADPDVAKSNDKSQSKPKDQFLNAVDQTREMFREMIGE